MFNCLSMLEEFFFSNNVESVSVHLLHPVLYFAFVDIYDLFECHGVI